MTQRLTIRLEDLPKHLEALGPKIKRAVQRGLVGAAIKVRSELETTIAESDPPPVNTGEFRAGWRVTMTKTGALVGNATPQSVWTERGRQPGPVSAEGRRAIALWVKRKGLAHRMLDAEGRGRTASGRYRKSDVDEAADRLAFVIARKIAERGYPPRWPLRRALAMVDATQTIREELAKVVA